MADLIDRQAAIDAMRLLEQEDIDDYGVKIPEGFDAEPAVKALKALPSAQQYMKATSNTVVSDTVKIPVMDGTTELLPPAQPQITLESAIDYLHSIGWMQEHDRVLTERKTGRWTPIPSLFRTLGICSVCHNVSGNEYEYCPWCGAKMEVADGE